MEAIILQSKNKSRFRFGTAGFDKTSINRTSVYFHSDTLFSALVNTHAQVLVHTDSFVEKFIKTNEISISSGSFCFEKDNKFIFFFHKPIFLNLLLEDTTLYKTFKGIQFVSKKIWDLAYLPTEILDKSKCTIIGGKFVCTNEELKYLGIQPYNIQDYQPFHLQILPKVSIHTDDQNERLFFQASIELIHAEHLRLKTHYFFLLEDSKATISNGLLELLAETGIGGELNVGCGKIDAIKRENIFFDFGNEQSLFHVSASLIFPKDLDELKKLGYYQTIVRGGRKLGHGGDWLNEIKGFQEGCLVKDAPKSVGHCPNLANAPEKKYLRYGYGFLLPISKQWEDAILRHEKNYLGDDKNK